LSKKANRRIQFVVYAISVILLIAILFQIYRIFIKKDNWSSGVFLLKGTVSMNDYDIVFGHDTSSNTIYMYSSYSCMFCAKFFKEVFPTIKEEYIDKGKLRLVLKLLDNSSNAQSLQAVQLAMCSNAYGNYPMLHDLLIFNRSIIYSKDFEFLVEDVMTKNEFIAQCMMEEETIATLENNNNEYKTFELKGTPTFIYKGVVYTGFYDIDSFRGIIN